MHTNRPIFCFSGLFEDTVCDLVLWGSLPKLSYLICHLNSSLGSSRLEVEQPSPSPSRLCLLLTCEYSGNLDYIGRLCSRTLVSVNQERSPPAHFPGHLGELRTQGRAVMVNLTCMGVVSPNRAGRQNPSFQLGHGRLLEHTASIQ